MVFTKEVYQQALTDFKRLQSELEKHCQSSLDDLYERLSGWNLREEGETFDCNFGLLTVTIEAKEDGSGYFIHPLLEIWSPDTEYSDMGTLTIQELENVLSLS